MCKKLNPTEFKIRVEEIHPIYDFTNTNYISHKEKVNYICLKHGVCSASPGNLLSGRACIKCAYELKSFLYRNTRKNFIQKSEKIHGIKYNYDSVKYINNRTKVTIHCNTCDKDFEQAPAKHLQGQGCPKCSITNKVNKQRGNKESFVQKSNLIHNNKYDYSKFEYINNRFKSIITCPIHGDFTCSPSNHLNKRGCHRCGNERISKKNSENPPGWTYTNWKIISEKSKHFDSFKVYVIECYNQETGERFIKIGKTFKSVKNRFNTLKSMPYNYKILKEIIFNEAKECCEYEKELKNKYKQFKYIPLINFCGIHECFNLTTKNNFNYD